MLFRFLLDFAHVSLIGKCNRDMFNLLSQKTKKMVQIACTKRNWCKTLVHLAVLYTIVTMCAQYSRADTEKKSPSYASARHLYFEYLAELNVDFTCQYDDCDTACSSEKALWASDLCRFVCEVVHAAGILTV